MGWINSARSTAACASSADPLKEDGFGLVAKQWHKKSGIMETRKLCLLYFHFERVPGACLDRRLRRSDFRARAPRFHENTST